MESGSTPFAQVFRRTLVCVIGICTEQYGSCKVFNFASMRLFAEAGHFASSFSYHKTTEVEKNLGGRFFARAGVFASSFSRMRSWNLQIKSMNFIYKFPGEAVRPTSGARALETSGADVIAGLVGAMHEAKRVRDMRKYPFWARCFISFNAMLLLAQKDTAR